MKIGELLNMKSNTVGDIVRRFRNVGRVASIKQKGRPKKLTTIEKQLILRKVKTKLCLSAPKLVDELFTEHEKTVAAQTIRRTNNGRVARKNMRNGKLRIELAVNHLKKDESW